jgi:hypothetical protein
LNRTVRHNSGSQSKNLLHFKLLPSGAEAARLALSVSLPLLLLQVPRQTYCWQAADTAQCQKIDLAFAAVVSVSDLPNAAAAAAAAGASPDIAAPGGLRPSHTACAGPIITSQMFIADLPCTTLLLLLLLL